MDNLDLKIENLPVNELKPYEKNAKKHPDEQVEHIANSIKRFGFKQPLVVDKDNVLVIGHGRLLAAKKLKMKEVPCVRADDLTEEEIKALRLADNKTNESEWDLDFLNLELDDITNIDMTDFGFDLSIDADGLDNIEEDEFPEDVQTRCKEGDIWQLGDHRLICGDSTNMDTIAELMDGEVADLLLTDPPYNVNYEGTAGKIQNDNMEDGAFRQFLRDAFYSADSVLRGGACFYIFHADSEGYNFRGACRDVEWTVRECLIWKKSSLVMGRQDYQWIHEPCQPAGTMVWTPTGETPIEKLVDGDRVISFDPGSGCVKGYKEGLEIQTAQREYKGTLYGIRVGDKQTWATDNHEFSVRFNANTADKWSTYLMRNDKGWWRVGVTRTYDARGFGLKHRVDQEHATEAWIIETFETQADAQMGEQLLACKYCIPYTHWEINRGMIKKETQRSEKQVEWIYGQISLEDLQKNAEQLLADYGRSIKYPLVSRETKADKFSRRVTAKINACNILPGLMMVPVPKKKYEGNSTFEYKVIDAVDRKEHDGLVYSLAVDKYHHYVADGIVTHNCLYGWKNGASHLWASDRKQTTVIEYDKPTKNDMHPTMKPVGLCAYLLCNNTHAGDKVLDLFGGSGSTLIACEQTKRKCYTCELDTRFADVIIQRWENLTGREAVLLPKGENNE